MNFVNLPRKVFICLFLRTLSRTSSSSLKQYESPVALLSSLMVVVTNLPTCWRFRSHLLFSDKSFKCMELSKSKKRKKGYCDLGLYLQFENKIKKDSMLANTYNSTLILLMALDHKLTGSKKLYPWVIIMKSEKLNKCYSYTFCGNR